MARRRFSTAAQGFLRKRIVETDPLIARVAALRARQDEEEDERNEIVEELLDPKLPLKRYVSILDPDYRWYRHCDVLAERLQAIADDELFRLLIFEPPRHGKTRLASQFFPAYYLRRHLRRWVALASYAAELAQTNSREVRELFTRGGGILNPKSKAVKHWETIAKGGLWASGVGGPATGKGFNLGVIDDPLKNDDEAQSETIREKQKRWYRSTWYTRRAPRAALIHQQTRWHNDDLAGSMLADEDVEPERWHILCFDATREARQQIFPITCTVEPDWRKTDEALCPERYDEEALRKIRARVGPYYWAAMYQQRPVAAGGTVFREEWWRYYGAMPPKFHQQLLSLDCAFKDETDSDFVVLQAWGRVYADIYLLDQIRARLDFTATLKALAFMAQKWPKASAKLVEDKANGPAVISTLRKKIGGIVPIDPEGGKLSRAHAVAPYVESGNFYLPDQQLALRRAAEWREVARLPGSWLPDDYVRADWVGGFVAEHSNFPRGAYDDQVDATTQAGKRLTQEPPSAPTSTEALDRKARSIVADAIGDY